jgi:hypothetical protein
MPDARPWPLIAVGVAAVLIGMWPLLWMLRRFARRVTRRLQNPVAGSRYVLALVASALFLALGFAALSLAAMLSTWRAFTKKTHVAEVQAIELSPRKIRIYLVPIASDESRGATEIYDVDGDEWQVGGDVLRFRPSLTALGVTTVYRLTRVEGHWSTAADANAHTGTAFDREKPSASWMRLYRDADKAPLKWLVAGAHGQSVSQLPDRRAVFDVYVTPNGYVLDKRTL